MLILMLIFLLFSTAITTRCDKSLFFFYNKVSIIGILFWSIVAYIYLGFYNLGKGIGVYGGLFYYSSITQVFLIFVLLLSSVILILTGFYSRDIYNNEGEEAVDSLSLSFILGCSNINPSLVKKYGNDEKRFNYILTLFTYTCLCDSTALLSSVISDIPDISIYPDIEELMEQLGDSIWELPWYIIAILFGLLSIDLYKTKNKKNVRRVVILETIAVRFHNEVSMATIDLNDPTGYNLRDLYYNSFNTLGICVQHDNQTYYALLDIHSGKNIQLYNSQTLHEINLIGGRDNTNLFATIGGYNFHSPNRWTWWYLWLSDFHIYRFRGGVLEEIVPSIDNYYYLYLERRLWNVYPSKDFIRVY